MIGEVRDGYMIVDHLGEGVYWKTYLVKKGGGIYTLKVMKPEYFSPALKKGGFRRFRREANRLRKVASPYTVAYTGCGFFDETEYGFYMTAEYVTGRNLEACIRERGKALAADEEGIKRILSQVLRGLHAMHEAGVNHRNLKPANIFVTEDGNVQIADYGIAGLFELSLSAMGRQLDLPQYLSPEVIGGKRPDYRSDLYSFGVIAYRLVTGSLPFSGENVFVVSNSVLKTAPAPPSSKRPEVSPELEKLLLTLLEKKRSARQYAGALELEQELDRIRFFTAEQG